MAKNKLNEDVYVASIEGQSDKEFPKNRQGLTAAYRHVQGKKKWVIMHRDNQGNDVDLVDMDEDSGENHNDVVVTRRRRLKLESVLSESDNITTISHDVLKDPEIDRLESVVDVRRYIASLS